MCVCVRSCISSVHKMHVLTEVSCSGCVSDYLCDTVIKWLCVCLCVVELMKCVCVMGEEDRSSESGGDV